MSFAPIGGMLIDKGIDQFTYGVGQEYRRHERHRLRDYQTEDYRMQRQFDLEDQKNKFTNEFNQKMALANQFGIHPLAMIGSGSPGGSSPIISGPRAAPPTSTPSGRFLGTLQTKDEKRIIRANARKAEAEATIWEKQAKQTGQNPDNFHVGNASFIDGQPNADIYSVSDQSGGSPVGVEQKVVKGQRYTTDKEGNFYLIPSQTVQEAFSDEGTIQNQFLYQMRENSFPIKVNKLRNNWGSRRYREFKRRFLESRPQPRKKDEVVLWNGIQWQAFYKTKDNANRIFAKGVPTYRPRRKKLSVYNSPYPNDDGIAP